MNLFRFVSPIWLTLLAPLFICGIANFFLRRRMRNSVLFSTVSDLDQIPPSAAVYVKKILPAFFYLGAAALIVALARPQLGVQESRILGNGISIAMCVDRSGSMAAEDFYIDHVPSTVCKP